ncbi:MAG: S9 family peptidase [bacterium]|nr:MAG: S9 family peptidase [bacterium]
MIQYTSRRKRTLAICIGFLALLLAAETLRAAGYPEGKTAEQDTTESESLPITEWLLLGAIPSPYPAFSSEGKEKIDAAYLLSYQDLTTEGMIPSSGETVNLAGGRREAWRRVTAGSEGVEIVADTAMPHIAYLACYLETSRWLEAKLEVRSNRPFDVNVDGRSVVKRTKNGSYDKKETGRTKIKQGKHLILAKTVFTPGDTVTGWQLSARIIPKGHPQDAIGTSIIPRQRLSIEHILDVPWIRGASISPDGELIAVTMNRFKPPEGEREGWLEIRRFTDGSTVYTIRDITGLSNVAWAPAGDRLSYKTTSKGKGSIRIIDLGSGEIETIVEEIEELGGYDWSPDGTYIVYSVTGKPEPDKTGVKRLRGLTDRWHYGRDRSHLYTASVPRGVTRRITAGRYSAYLEDIHPDGATLLISRNYEDLADRPYGWSELVRMDLASGETEILFKAPWLRSATWSPDGTKIMVLGGPSIFGDLGKNIPEGEIPNDYDTQAYIYDPVTKDIDPITKEFDPAINRAHWSRADGNIYFVAEEGEYVRTYRYHPGKKSYRRLELGFEVIERGSSFARGTARAAMIGSGVGHPTRLYAVDLKQGRAKEILDPGACVFSHVQLGAVEKWSFTSSGGKSIDGRIHYPPDFDPEKSYPCIVYYYGGTSPVNRSFGGRYPKNLWAAKGYVVYVLQPSGATGYGQAFSARHVNDWGKTTSDEIIEGVTKFLDAHPFVDRSRIGCIGASYGGFMTQLLVTRTDIFAAAVSHAGISSITSYWGEGYWGYGYSAVATAESFPWNRRDIYVDQSPLFSADKVHTPLLLLHGASDTNVPPGESDQMYIALKLLGKPVEYIRFAEQNHFILDYKKRKIWNDAIVSWFDRWLKEEPEWWNNMYPPLEEEPAGEPADIGLHSAELEGWGTVLLGEVTRAAIVDHIPHWDEEYFTYAPDASLLPEIQELMTGVKLVIVLGTWCSDSQREIPRLWKILDEIGFPAPDARTFAVGSSRFTEDMPIAAEALTWSTGIKDLYKIELVATIIVNRDGRELGRIIETPVESLEKDLLRILKK